jgi:hypothetical protein
MFDFGMKEKQSNLMICFQATFEVDDDASKFEWREFMNGL